MLGLSGTSVVVLNVAEAPGNRPTGDDVYALSGLGQFRYVLSDPTEVAKPDPTLLRLLQDAVSSKQRLGDMANYLKEAISRQSDKFKSSSVVLDEAQLARRIHGASAP